MEMLFEIMMRISLKQFNSIKTWASYCVRNDNGMCFEHFIFHFFKNKRKDYINKKNWWNEQFQVKLD